MSFAFAGCFLLADQLLHSRQQVILHSRIAKFQHDLTDLDYDIEDLVSAAMAELDQGLDSIEAQSPAAGAGAAEATGSEDEGSRHAYVTLCIGDTAVQGVWPTLHYLIQFQDTIFEGRGWHPCCCCCCCCCFYCFYFCSSCWMEKL